MTETIHGAGLILQDTSQQESSGGHHSLNTKVTGTRVKPDI